METQTHSSNPSSFYRFQIYQREKTASGHVDKKKVVGMAYLKEGQSTYTIRLWTFLQDRFYLIQSRQDPERYLLMTREPNTKPGAKNKYFWNIVGNARTDSAAGLLRIEFDLFSEPVFMSLFPEAQAQSASMADPIDFEAAA